MSRMVWLRRLARVGLALLVSWNARAQAPLPAEVFFKPAEFIDAKLSPSGRRLALTTLIGGERIGLFVWDLEDQKKSTRAARFADADIRNVEWVDDERLLFDVIDLAAGGGEQVAPGLYSVRFDGQELRQLVMRRNLPFISSPGSGRPPLEWFHRLLQVPAGSTGEVIVGEMRFQGNDLASVHPLWLNVATGRTRSMALKAPEGVLRWIFDSRGEARVAVSRRSDRQRVHWRGPGQDEWRLIDDSPLLAPQFTPRFVDDQGGLYVTRPEGAAGTSVLARFDFATGKPDPKPFVRTPGFDFLGALEAESVGGKLLGVRVDTDAETTVWFDSSLKRVQQLADERLPGYVNRLSCRRCGSSDMVVLVRAASARDPGHLWLYRADGERWQFVSRLRKDVDAKLMAQVEFERIQARDGRDLPLWLTVPPGRKAGDRGPAVVLVHGGPWVRGGHWRWRATEQFLASRGYVVISPEFRGSAGYGSAHLTAGFKQWGRAMQDDVADAARWALKQGWADRLCIAGASYGGYSTLMGLVNDPELYRCGVAWLAVADPFLYLQGSWWTQDDIGDVARRHTMPQMVGDAEKDAHMLKAVSPVEQAARIKTPLLLAYGARDRRVPIEHGERVRKAMRAAGQEPEWVVYSDEAHGWLKLENQVDFANRFEVFLARHLKN